jgi:hypothetical protein
MGNVIFSAPVSLCFVEVFWQKHRTSANNCIKHKAMVVGQTSSKYLGCKCCPFWYRTDWSLYLLFGEPEI